MPFLRGLVRGASHHGRCSIRRAPASAGAPPPNGGDLSVHPVPRAAYDAPHLTPIEPGDALYPIARGLELLVRARTHCPPDLAAAITAYMQELPPADMPPPTPDRETGELPDDDEPAPFARMPGSMAGERAQGGPVMPQPPPPAPAFVPPPPRAVRRPPYSNGCAHPAGRLAPSGRGVSCLDCSTDFPNFAAQ